jgi:hypothetical protein
VPSASHVGLETTGFLYVVCAYVKNEPCGVAHLRRKLPFVGQAKRTKRIQRGLCNLQRNR